MTTIVVKLLKKRQNMFCGLTFTCPICGGRNCAGRQLKHRRHKHLGKAWVDEYYCTNTGQSIQADDLLATLKEEHSDPLPTIVKFFLVAWERDEMSNGNSDDQVTKFNCLGCGTLFATKHRLLPWPSCLLKVICDYCGNEYLLPRPGEIFCSRKLGKYAYIGWEDDEVTPI